MKLTDISNRLGLSISTVSRALRNAEGVDTRTRTRVLTEAARAGYRGPVRQRLGRSGKTKTMLVLSRIDAGSIWYDAMAGMSQAAIEFNVSILTHQTPHETPESILIPKLQPPAMRTGQLDGIVLLNEWPEAIVAELQLIQPVVSMLYDYPECDFVGVDELEGIKSLVSRVQTPVGYFGICRGSTIHTRLHAAFKAWRDDKNDSPVVEIQRGECTENGSQKIDRKEFFRHLDRGVHSWICPDFSSAETLRDWEQSLGSGRPGDLWVGIFHPAGRQTASTLPWISLDIPGDELGIAAVRRLLERIDHPQESIRHILLKSALSPGDSQPAPNVPISR